jgi:kynureninase
MQYNTRQDALALDAADPLASFRSQFALPEGVIYLDGNSLGALPKKTQQVIANVISEEWGVRLIRSWNISGWYEMPRRVGDKIAKLIGANEGEVVAADSTSVNTFKVLSAALQFQAKHAPQRTKILSEELNFPTDLYIIEGTIAQLGNRHQLVFKSPDEIIAAIDEHTAVVTLTQVNYKTGRLYDMAAITKAAHAKGALVIWDLAHTAGALPVNLNACDVDFAIGCGYKYLNGGPGAPAFVFVAKRMQNEVTHPLSGWMSHADPFAFTSSYAPATGIPRFLTGTPPVLSMAALECSLDLWLQADMNQVREKSQNLTDMFIALVEQRCAKHGLKLATPRERAQRGSQVSFHHPDGFAIMQAVIARGVIGDFRAPDILRFGFTPLYTRYVDVWDAVEILRDVLDSGAYRDEKFAQRRAVT